MKREIVITGDGSTTIHLPDWDEQYHSKHGAIQEAYHVFLKHGLHFFCNEISQLKSLQNTTKTISILEIGFGTGLNAFITLLEAEKLNIKINYSGVEGYPVPMDEINQLNYAKELEQQKKQSTFISLHKCSWEDRHTIASHFLLNKQKKMFCEIDDENEFDIIYFDAFGARVQPELWTEAIFKKMYDALKDKGVLVTYSAKGSVRRAMQSVGFLVERLPGPPGKREMLRASK
ncbi:tRNA (5-methylaminomethyl-2-thiouridine)(34)-methyltransferase MnmD [Algibacter aquimarinus]|uniref:tRNA (5-methylaminomethyl-2-thiouridine)(34)-methyltransferase MnmD n=1 Tax=Algibacter aquimarinus TaxID=1136748 RepID=A0ABP9HRZ8_9FLAO